MEQVNLLKQLNQQTPNQIWHDRTEFNFNSTNTFPKTTKPRKFKQNVQHKWHGKIKVIQFVTQTKYEI